MTAPPRNIAARRDLGQLEITWPDGVTASISFHALRCACHCAVCVDEHTGIRLLDPATIPADIQPLQLSLTGNYALKIHWSDGHQTGLYTWERLHQLTRGAT